MEKWFVLGWIMTVLWGNGAVEQRTEWSHVFYGTAEQCRTEAAAFLRPEVDRAANLPASVRAPSAKHGIMPDLYNGGIVSMKPMSAFCAPFTSEEHIKKAFPGWDVMAGLRARADGTTQSFDWWDGPTGAAR